MVTAFYKTNWNLHENSQLRRVISNISWRYTYFWVLPFRLQAPPLASIGRVFTPISKHESFCSILSHGSILTLFLPSFLSHSFLAILANGALARVSAALHMVRRFSNGHQA